MEPGILVSGAGLARRFGAKVALESVDLIVRAGEPLALFGANGAGKTTLLRILSGVLVPTAGAVSIDRRRIGLVSHRTHLYEDLSALENLVFFAKLNGIDEPEARAREELAAVGLADRAGEPVRGFSRGMQQRVALARALVHRPTLLLLDEPSTGLDPRSRDTLRSNLSARATELTWIIASHDVEEGLALSRRWVLLSDGRVAGSGVSGGEDAERARAAVASAA